MDNQTLIIVWIVVLAVIALTANRNQDKTEGFHTYYGYYKKYCPSCGWRSRYSCAKCTNCGYCIDKNGYGQCVPGDSSGPYFHGDKCSYWEFGSPNYQYPFSNVYPTVKIRSQYPYYRWRLRRPWRWQDKYQRMRPVKK